MSYDPLGRLRSLTDATATTRFDYDVLDNPSRVVDPGGAATVFLNDDLGRTVLERSPDRGLLQSAYDRAGNLSALLDARGLVSSFAYDGANRLLAQRFGGALMNAAARTVHRNGLPGLPWHRLDKNHLAQGAERIAFDYVPPGRPGAGRLARIREPLVSTRLGYDAFGQLAELDTVYKPPAAEPIRITQRYARDNAGRPLAETLPGGQRLTYRYRGADLEALELDGRPLLAGLLYHPGGALQQARYGNGLAFQQTFDLATRITTQRRATRSVAYTYDGAGNLSGQGRERYQYDALERLIEAEAPDQDTIGYRYDANGNRTELRQGPSPGAYTTATGSNRTRAVNGRAIRYDASGNRIEDARFEYRYNARNRLAQVIDKSSGGRSRYQYNALGLRVWKQRPDGTRVYYVYNRDNRLSAELDAAGHITRQYLWLGAMPLAVLEQGRLYYIHPDHLGTPRVVTDEHREVVWRWRSTPFGRGLPEESGLRLNLRFPGQYFDKETGLFYNYFRTYDPGSGRYLQADPIGLAGGINPYLYVGANPLRWIDPLGLRWETIGTDYHGWKNWGMGIANRLANLEEGTIASPKNCVGCTRDVIQEWIPHPDDPQNNRKGVTLILTPDSAPFRPERNKNIGNSEMEVDVNLHYS